MQPEFISFNKIHRFNREIIITEKIDGTNAQIFIDDNCEDIYAASRNRWITPSDDNFGFAGWVEQNKKELLKLGPGRHFGEWWGKGIGRSYGLNHRKFSLFNTSRWNAINIPECCSVVPLLYKGLMLESNVFDVLSKLQSNGSIAAPGFMNPEGIVVYHTHSDMCFKMTLDKNDNCKTFGEKI